MKYLYSIIIFTVLFGCSKMPETRYFTLAHKNMDFQNKESNKIILVKPFKSDPVYHQDKFVYRPSEYEIKFDHYRRWVQSPPQILTSRLIEFLKSRNDIGYVSSEIRRNEGYFQLECTLLRFEETIFGPKRTAVIAIEYELLQMPKRNLLKSGFIEKSETITDTNAEDIVSALGTATFNAFSELAVVIQE